MAKYEPPSFSLGFDLDCDFESNPALDSCTHPSFSLFDDDDVNLDRQVVVDSDPEPDSEPPRVLKRLRRGEAVTRLTPVKKVESVQLSFNNDDEDIEEFSSQEDVRGGDACPSTRYNSVCSSSKALIYGCRMLRTESSQRQMMRKNNQSSDTLPSATSVAQQNKFMFPKLTISPLRKFQLLSDSDDDGSDVENVNREENKIDPSSKRKQAHPCLYTTVNDTYRTKISVDMPPNQDLWKDFTPMKSFGIPTPALDEVCEEYFQSLDSKNIVQEPPADTCITNIMGRHRKEYRSQTVDKCRDLSNTLSPSQYYYFHDDPRIQKLVRNRLPHYHPQGVSRQPSASTMNYMNQFNNGETSKKVKENNSLEGSTARTRKKSKKSTAQKALDARNGWVNPNCSGNIPRNAGKNRVHAGGPSAGHWYTGPNGKRVYVTKNGQELMGQIAYRHYKKENGGGFQKSKSKKKGSTKKRKN